MSSTTYNLVTRKRNAVTKQGMKEATAFFKKLDKKMGEQ